MISRTGLFSSLSTDHLQRYSRIIQEGIAVRGHFDLLKWLQKYDSAQHGIQTAFAQQIHHRSSYHRQR